MKYYFSRILEMTFDDAVRHTTEVLNRHGFGIITQIDVTETLKKKLGVNFRPYCILGACNPAMAHYALQIEDKIGTMLPCNVVVQDLGAGKVEVAAIDPVASMAAVDNPQLKAVAGAVRDLLAQTLEDL